MHCAAWNMKNAVAVGNGVYFVKMAMTLPGILACIAIELVNKLMQSRILC